MNNKAVINASDLLARVELTITNQTLLVIVVYLNIIYDEGLSIRIRYQTMIFIIRNYNCCVYSCYCYIIYLKGKTIDLKLVRYLPERAVTTEDNQALGE